MKKYLAVNSQGNINYTFTTDDESYDNFQLAPGVTSIVCPENFTDVEFDKYYIKLGQVKVKPARPSEYFVWNSTDERWDFELNKMREAKSIATTRRCEIEIHLGYKSSALGSEHHYPANDKDQLNMIASVTDSYGPTNETTWKTLFWCKDVNEVWNYREHTAAQIQKAGSDGKTFITNQLGKNALLQYQISQATTKEELDLITW